MSKIDDLNFTVTLYHGQAKIHRFTLNYLLPHAYEVIEDYFLSLDQKFYTAVSIEYKGELILYKVLTDNKVTDGGR